MLRLYHFTGSADLKKIDLTQSITAESQTIFTSAPTGVYFTTTNPKEFCDKKFSYDSLSCHVEIEISIKDPLLSKCAPYDGMDVYFYERSINLDQFKCRTGPNSSWKASSSVNWKMVLGVAALGAAAVIVGKVAYDAFQENEREKEKLHQETLSSLGWEEGVGKKGSRLPKKEGFLKIGQKEVTNLQFYEPPIKDSSVSDFVSSFIYKRKTSFASEEDGVCGVRNLTDNVYSKFGSQETKEKTAIDFSDDTETADMEEAFVLLKGPKMSQICQLESLYNSRVKVEKLEQKRYLSLMKNLVGTIIAKMKEKSKTFNALYIDTYFGGSVFDGLKVNSTEQEFDLNILLKWKAKDLEVVRLGHDSSKKNFCFLKVTKKTLNQFEEKILDTDGYGPDPGSKYLSPMKMFNLVKSSVDKVLTNEAQVINHEGNSYRVTRHEFAPVTLKVVSLDNFQPMAFEIDLVPSLKLELDTLEGNSNLRTHVTALCDEYGVSEDTRSFMAISLHKADKHKFELDFHDVERKILFNRGCTKKVIKLIKFLRDSKGGTAEKLWSHLLKTSVMHHVMKTPQDYWNNANLEKCVVDCLRNLLEGLRQDSITDVFFPDVNLLDRIKKPQVKEECITWLDKLLRNYDRTGNVMNIFK